LPLTFFIFLDLFPSPAHSSRFSLFSSRLFFPRSLELPQRTRRNQRANRVLRGILVDVLWLGLCSRESQASNHRRRPRCCSGGPFRGEGSSLNLSLSLSFPLPLLFPTPSSPSLPLPLPFPFLPHQLDFALPTSQEKFPSLSVILLWNVSFKEEENRRDASIKQLCDAFAERTGWKVGDRYAVGRDSSWEVEEGNPDVGWVEMEE